LTLKVFRGEPLPNIRQFHREGKRSSHLYFFSLAKACLARKHINTARALADMASQLNPQFPDAYILRARVHEMKGEWREGIAACERAMQIKPENPHFGYLRQRLVDGANKPA
jgi:Tfp pilus assembly protein PilF